MENFLYSIPTKVYFGKGQIEKLEMCLKEFGENVLFVYGGNSIKKNGIYDAVKEIADNAQLSLTELSGVKPNPRITSVNEGARLCREYNIDVILAVGGGSVIDCSKAISAAAAYDGDAWDIVMDNSLIGECIPIVTILTLAATGSEMDAGGMLVNEELKIKGHIGNPKLAPKYSILDPVYTYSVSERQTAAGAADILSHIMEVYFKEIGDTYMQDRIMEALMKTVIHYGPIACKEPENYDARANLMWASSWAMNKFISCGKSAYRWVLHPMEHQLGAYYDDTHGIGLAVLTPPWLEHILSEKTLPIFVKFGVNVFDIDENLPEMEIARESIARVRQFYESMGLPKTIRESGIGLNDPEIFETMASNILGKGDLLTSYIPLTKEEIVDIFRKAY